LASASRAHFRDFFEFRFYLRLPGRARTANAGERGGLNRSILFCAQLLVAKARGIIVGSDAGEQ
jgi:hypothetical protein